MRFYREIVFVVLALCAAFMVGCSDERVDNREHNYGYAQFKLYKKVSYGESDSPAAQTRAVKDELDYLADAHKIKVTLVYDGITISQTLTLSTIDASMAEFGMRSDKIKLLVGHYNLISFSLYNSLDELIYNGTPDTQSEFTVEEGGLTSHDVTVNVEPRGSVRFTFKKDIQQAEASRAAVREYTFDEVAYVNVNVVQRLASGAMANPVKIEGLPVKFSVHFDEDDDVSDKEGYQTSSLACDSLISLPAGRYVVTAYETLDESKSLLESRNNLSACQFEVADNQTSEVDMFLKLDLSAEYVRDYYALYEIWKALDGENWYYDGGEHSRGVNWDFNKDMDLWGDQPGVYLHSNGRVARIDISGFGFRGDMPAALGQLTELIELYLGTHNDSATVNYDPSLSLDKSLAERNRNRMDNHRQYLGMIHTPVQVSEPVARALAERGISIPATKLYETMGEKEIFDMATGEQRQRHLFDTNHGTLCNGLRSLPREIANLKKLEYLYIANSEIESIPDEVAELSSLTDLEIYNCPRLERFPVAIGNMEELISLNLSNNYQWSAEEIYAGLDALATGPSAGKIQILYARQNNLEELPASFRNMEKLGLLDLAFNKISKLHPLGRKVSLVQLYLDHNKIESLPVDDEGYFCGCDDVENFSVSYNLLKKIPNIFSANSNYRMKSVDFSANDITGCEGEENGTYKGINVETFTLTLNPNMKRYPEALAKTNSSVAYIILRACGLETIPEGSFTYRNSVDLQSLDLSYNKLTTLPRDMHAANLPYLYGVELSFNSFSSFPYQPLDSSGLTVLAVRSQRDANGARCLKEWPTGIGNHRGMRGLYLGSNDLRKIDDTISTLIYVLDISDNPNIIFDASDICYAWQVGAYMLIYDKTQNILNCDAMLD
ncbi:MAG: DUF4458 domain-containing protein [Alistipes sp.]|nr:DUF4458 domain-containing protein [Alistipes sp.]